MRGVGWLSGCLLLGLISSVQAQSLVPNGGDEKRDPPVAVPVDEAEPGGAGDALQVTEFDGFTVVGSHQQIRGGIASLAGGMSSDLSRLTGEVGRQIKLPIIIRLHGQEGDREQARSVVTRIDQVQGQYHLKIHIHLAKGVDHQKLRYHLMEALLYERGLSSGQVVDEGDRIEVKPWLVVGLLEALDVKHGRANRRIYQAELPYFDILPLQEVFDTSAPAYRELDGRKPAVFRAISGAMVNALLRQPDGRRGIAGYLKDVATFKGEQENLMRKHFPSMNKSRNSLSKWIDLEMAELGTATLVQVYTLLETEKRLQSVLQLRYRDEEEAAVSVELDGYREVIGLSQAERVDAVSGAHAELGRLSYRCFPTYRPLLLEYEMILKEIAKGEDERIEARLSKLLDIRVKLQIAGKRVRDYLDWYYITRSDEVSGSFDDYRELSDALRQEALRERGQGPFRSYLDQVESIYGGR